MNVWKFDSPPIDSSLLNVREEPRRWTVLTAIDDETNRKYREEKVIQIRKDKRNDLTNSRRNKISEDSTVSTSDLFTAKRREDIIRNHESLAEKSKLIYSDKPGDLEIATEYFRRLLSIDRKPPIAVVVERGVVPRIVELLTSPIGKVAFEAAWCVTNISSGENHNLEILLHLETIPRLISVIQKTEYINVREQCLWALSNLATDSTGRCKASMIDLNIMEILLWQLDMVPPPPNCTRQESPALSIMRYVSWILCSLSKGEPVLSPALQEQVIHAFSELLYSPDMEIMADICSALTFICELRPYDNTQCCFELGIPYRLIELCDLSFGFSIRPLCSMIAFSPDALHRRVLTSSMFPSTMKLMVKEYEDMIHPWKVNSSLPVTRSGPVVATAGSCIGLFEATSNAKIIDDIAEDVCKAMLSLFQTDTFYISAAMDLNFLKRLTNAITIGAGSYGVKLQSGYCLCAMAMCLNNLDVQDVHLIVSALRELFTVTDNRLLVQVLQCVLKMMQMYYSLNEDVDAGLADDSSLMWLCNHPVQEVSDLAIRIVGIICDRNDG